MSGIVGWVLAEAWPYMLAVLGAMASWFAIRQSGKQAGKAEARIDQLEADNKAVEEARNERQKVDALGDDAARRDAARWVRGDK